MSDQLDEPEDFARFRVKKSSGLLAWFLIFAPAIVFVGAMFLYFLALGWGR
jgi:hypothetical protein